MSSISGTPGYEKRRGQVERYFDQTAADIWARLTSPAPVDGIRATVRAGREEMARRLLTWLPPDLHGARVLDAGCGTGAMAQTLAKRGADVVAVDLSPALIDVARRRLPETMLTGSITFHVGDMLEPRLGRFDHVVAMDSLIHYQEADIARSVESLAARCTTTVAFTIAPWTGLLYLMHVTGRLLPASHRAPDLTPIRSHPFGQALQTRLGPSGWSLTGRSRVGTTFYKSEALCFRR